MILLRPTCILLRTCCRAAVLLLALAGGEASAQLHLPGLPLPGRVGPLDTSLLRERLLNTSDLTDRIRLDQLRLTQAADLLRRHPDVLEADPRGFPVVRRVIVAWAPSSAGLAAARAAGLELAGQQDVLDQPVLTFRVPESVSTADALASLRAADPDGGYDFDHIYTGSASATHDAPVHSSAADTGSARADAAAGRTSTSGNGTGAGLGGAHNTRVRTAASEAGDAGAGGAHDTRERIAAAEAGGAGVGGAHDTRGRAAASEAGGATAGGANDTRGRAAAAEAGGSGAVRVGLVDSGVDGRHEVFDGAAIRRWGCDGKEIAAAHGTAVAALMVGRSERFAGVAPGATLYAADIYCDQPTGGAATQIVGALSWLARENVGVINLSLVGPPNQLLERAVAAMIKRGHLLVAAVGNDGPAAPPLYPASYPGVVGVSGVDPKHRPLPEAARGPQVMFAAPGSQMVSATAGAPPYRVVRGTSFAAPIVAALLAPQLPRPDATGAHAAITKLAATAGNPGMKDISNATGYGIVGESYRADPAAFR